MFPFWKSKRMSRENIELHFSLCSLMGWPRKVEELRVVCPCSGPKFCNTLQGWSPLPSSNMVPARASAPTTATEVLHVLLRLKYGYKVSHTRTRFNKRKIVISDHFTLG